jgi:hypothetical protein
MPKANYESVTSVNFAGRVIPLKRPLATFAARRLERILPQIAALNAAGKSQADAAEALDTTISTLRKWIDLTETTWVNLKRRPAYKPRA